MIWGSSDNFRFYVDINGPKKPNVVGKDVFVFSYGVFGGSGTSQIDKLGPMYFWKARTDLIKESDKSSCSKNNNGWSCGALIMKDGWKISDDYPW